MNSKKLLLLFIVTFIYIGAYKVTTVLKLLNFVDMFRMNNMHRHDNKYVNTQLFNGVRSVNIFSLVVGLRVTKTLPLRNLQNEFPVSFQ